MKIGSILKIIFGGLLIVMGAMALTGYIFISSMNKVNDPMEVILQGSEKQALLIYQPSRSSLNDDVALKTGKLLNENGYTVTINYPSDKLNYDLNKYDVILFGSPVYASQSSSVLKGFIESNPIRNKKVLLYSVGMLSDNEEEAESMISIVDDSNSVKYHKYTEKTEDSFMEFIKNEL